MASLQLDSEFHEIGGSAVYTHRRVHRTSPGAQKAGVLTSWGCSHKGSLNWVTATTVIFSLTVLVVRSLKLRCRQGRMPPGGPGGSLPCLLSETPAFPGLVGTSLQSLPLLLHHVPPVRLHAVFPPCVSLCLNPPLPVRMPVLG